MIADAERSAEIVERFKNKDPLNLSAIEVESPSLLEGLFQKCDEVVAELKRRYQQGEFFYWNHLEHPLLRELCKCACSSRYPSSGAQTCSSKPEFKNQTNPLTT
jgi:hypothetical protein